MSLSFQDLQDLIVGNPILYNDQPLLSTVEEQRYRLATPPNRAEVLRIFLEGSNYRLSELSGSQKGNVVDMTYGEYESVGKQSIPMQRSLYIETAEGDQFSLDMNYSNLILGEVQKVDFSVPDSYEVL